MESGTEPQWRLKDSKSRSKVRIYKTIEHSWAFVSIYEISLIKLLSLLFVVCFPCAVPRTNMSNPNVIRDFFSNLIWQLLRRYVQVVKSEQLIVSRHEVKHLWVVLQEALIWERRFLPAQHSLEPGLILLITVVALKLFDFLNWEPNRNFEDLQHVKQLVWSVFFWT